VWAVGGRWWAVGMWACGWSACGWHVGGGHVGSQQWACGRSAPGQFSLQVIGRFLGVSGGPPEFGWKVKPHARTDPISVV
jgi:hypothetical protein